MITYRNHCDEEIEIPQSIDSFVREYEALCKKHNLMIISDGEPIIVIKYEKRLWDIRESIADDISCTSRRRGNYENKIT